MWFESLTHTKGRAGSLKEYGIETTTTTTTKTVELNLSPTPTERTTRFTNQLAQLWGRDEEGCVR